MNAKQRAIVEELLSKGRNHFDAPRKPIDFETGDKNAEELLNDIEGYPHLFVLACIMDRQISASRAWLIPYTVGKKIGGFEFTDFEHHTEQEFIDIFGNQEQKLHRFNKILAKSFYAAITDIREKYHGDASKIWADRPRSALVVRRFLEFAGAGVKIAAMAANLLARDFKVPMLDHSSIDISPDSRVKRYFAENGLLRPDGDIYELIYLAREINPDYPGLLDLGAWQGGMARQKISMIAP
jgi:hypothetical protein